MTRMLAAGSIAALAALGLATPASADTPDAACFGQVHKTVNSGALGIDNVGVRVASAEVTQRLAKGEDVDPTAYYFRTVPTFTVADGPHAWLRRAVFVARGIRRPDHVVIDVYEVE